MVIKALALATGYYGLDMDMAVWLVACAMLLLLHLPAVIVIVDRRPCDRRLGGDDGVGGENSGKSIWRRKNGDSGGKSSTRR